MGVEETFSEDPVIPAKATVLFQSLRRQELSLTKRLDFTQAS